MTPGTVDNQAYVDLGGEEHNHRGLLSGIVCACGREVKDIKSHHRAAHPTPGSDFPPGLIDRVVQYAASTPYTHKASWVQNFWNKERARA